MFIFNKIFRNVLPLILAQLSQKNIVALSRVNKQLNDICKKLTIQCEYYNGYPPSERILLCARDAHVLCLQKNKPTSQTALDNRLRGACEGGHLIMATNMIAQYRANVTAKHPINLNQCLQGACLRGHMNVVQMLIREGATNFQLGLRCASINGHIKIAKLMIDYGARGCELGLGSACEKNYVKLVALLVHNGATYCIICDKPAVQCTTYIQSMSIA
jgi:ankyrin repeat protein